ncbi:hypothetical protein SAMN05444396_103235 [Flavobacterium segetis]|uniref:Uncharacterized protein n=1 Tax=Flavobacterium segetis TaxID=271157 RepID=A0A1M5G3T3_9FLAO|nr:hypothetical protein [Flavobacterium segetis]SHF98092.1 hypothetical protein SAMN05444396_103235 [Flavobacterium segetis]
MNNKILFFFSLFLVLNSCQNEDEKRNAENLKETKKREVVFKKIEKAWIFYDTPVTDAAEKSVSSWSEWRIFLAELAQKPKKTIGAFQQKSTAITKKAMALNNNIPYNFSNPPVKSRISAVVTKVQMLDLYIHLDNIPDKKVGKLIAEINLELVSLQRQMDKIVEKGKIPTELGESELRKMRDTSRAIPNVIIDENTPRVE